MKTIILFAVISFFSRSIQAQGKPSGDLTKEQITTLVHQHFEVISNSDSVARLTTMSKIYTRDFHIVDTYFEHFNYKDFNATVSKVQKSFPNQHFALTSEIETLSSVARVSWRMGDQLTGQDIFVFKNGKISEIFAFVAPLKK